MRRIIILMALLTFVSGCGREDTGLVGGSPTPEPEALEEAIVRANCLTVQAAVEEFASHNDCIYPSNVDIDVTPYGSTVIDLLPQEARLSNPISLINSEPINGHVAYPGGTSYEPVLGPLGAYEGYAIRGFGAEVGKEIVRITDIDTTEGKVRRNCLRVWMAIDYFVDYNDDQFPTDVETDTNFVGKTLLDYLGGDYLENPYSGNITEPRNGAAILPGETGYEPIYDGDLIYGCRITGIGDYPGKVIVKYRGTNLNEERRVQDLCLALIGRAERFAYRNDGKYPINIDSDTDDYGSTLLDLIQGFWENPFTHASTEPRNGRAHNPGEIGYEAVSGGYGYIITGVGWNAGDIISEYIKIDTPADTMVKNNFKTVREAIEQFTFLNGGIPPTDIFQDTTPSGKTVIDLFPEGSLLVNPITGQYTEPQNHRAAYPGQVGYEYFNDEDYIFYSITGIGEKGAYIRRTWKNIPRT